mmetsp:Transcript_25787/g.60248  ORF Transcript_25787/g.60248 Transcript_25787/m.60248 type:complete len:725 (+) Transcript_25787:90-2264(+)
MVGELEGEHRRGFRAEDSLAPPSLGRIVSWNDRFQHSGVTYTRAEIEHILKTPLRENLETGFFESEEFPRTPRNGASKRPVSLVRNGVIFFTLLYCIACGPGIYYLVITGLYKEAIAKICKPMNESSSASEQEERSGGCNSSWFDARTSPGTAGPSPVAWCTSGGGIRALSSAIGFARAFHKASLIESQHLKAVSCNSGGCWFLSMFAYSKEFYKDVTETTGQIKDFVKDLVEHIPTVEDTHPEQQEAGPPATKGRRLVGLSQNGLVKTSCSLMKELFKSDGGEYNKMASVCEATSKHKFKWRSFIEELLNKTSRADDFAEIIADTESRKGLLGPALLMQTANTTSSWVYSRSYWPFVSCAYSLDAQQKFPHQNKSEYVFPTVPLQWYVPGTVSEKDDQHGFLMPDTFNNMNYMASWRSLPSFIHLGKRWHPDEINGKLIGWTRVTKMEPPWGGKAKVVDIASASSAAAGMMGSPLMMMDVLKLNCDSARTVVMELLPNGLQGLAVCGQEPKPGLFGRSECTFPAQTFVDGGFVDNLATAQTVRFMQDKYRGRTLRFVLTDAAQDTQPESQPINDPSWLKSGDIIDVSDLMVNTRPQPPGEKICDGSYVGVCRPSPQVFDCRYSDLHFERVESVDSQRGKERWENNDRLYWANTTTMTVRNDAFGVEEGTVVHLLIFVSASRLTAFQSGRNNQVPLRHASFAHAIAESEADKILSYWLKKTGGL